MSSPLSINRRQWLAGFGSMALSHLMARDGVAAPDDPLAPRPPHFPAKARAVISLFMRGGPSHVDTFDPKPVLTRHDGQPLPDSFKNLDLAQVNTSDGKLMGSTFPFRKRGQSGIEISDLFPHLAEHADELAVIRSCYHDLFIHGSAITLMQSGTVLLGHPSVGSWVSYGLGCESDSLPAYTAMTDAFFANGPTMYGSGFLPAVYQGTYLQTKGAPIQNLKRPPGMSAGGQRALLDQLGSWNRRHSEARPGDSRLNARIQNYELAYRMQTAAPDLIDITSETEATRNLYGLGDGPADRFGRMCLLARRMVERGVRYVYLVSEGWDAHGDCKGNHEEQAKKTDQPIAGLLADLKQRGLLESTLVTWQGEFGRTPIKQGNDGRDHNPYGFSSWMAGAGIRGGQVIGATDDLGFHAIEDKVHVNDLHATTMTLLGLDHERLTYLFEGRYRRLTDVGGANDLARRLTGEELKAEGK